MNHYRAVIFDLDGTLLNTLDDLADSVNHTLSAYGYPTHSKEDVCRFVGNGVRLLLTRSLPGGEETQNFEQIFADFCAYYAKNSRNKTAPYEGIVPLLEKLCCAGVRIGVVSNKFDAAVRELCQKYFGSLVTVAVGESATVPPKPAPDSVFRAMELLDVTAEDCVFVGDSEVDIKTAANAGMPCISVLWGFRDRACLAANGATCFAKDPAALATLL